MRWCCTHRASGRTDPMHIASGGSQIVRMLFSRSTNLEQEDARPSNTKVIIMEHKKRARVVKRATAPAFLPLYTDKNLHMTFNRSHPKVKDGMGCGLSTSNVKGHTCADNCRGGIRSYIINHQILIELFDRSHFAHYSAAALGRCNVSVLAARFQRRAICSETDVQTISIF